MGGKIAVAEYCRREPIVESTKEIAVSLKSEKLFVFATDYPNKLKREARLAIAQAEERYGMPCVPFHNLKKAIRKGEVQKIVLAGGHLNACHLGGFADLAKWFASAGRDGTIIMPFDCIFDVGRKGAEVQISGMDKESVVRRFFESISQGSYNEPYIKPYRGRAVRAPFEHVAWLMKILIGNRIFVQPSFRLSYDGKPVHSQTSDANAPTINVQLFSSNEATLQYLMQEAQRN